MANQTSRGQQRDKPFRDALRMELAAAGDNHKALRKIARNLIDLAASGDLPAIREIADRMDGKPAQAVGGDDDLGPVKHLLEVAWKSDESESN